jgi:hypothetical protein
MASIVIRPAVASDHNYLSDNFAKSYKHSAYATRTSTEVLRRLVEPLLSLWQVAIAAPAHDPDFILGWLLYKDAHTVGWIHVRPGEPRRKGIANKLLQHAGIVSGEIEVPFLPTKLEGVEGSFSNFAKAHGYELRFRPYMPLMEVLNVERAVTEVLTT